jgi:GDP-mannose 6-dehydrogenase
MRIAVFGLGYVGAVSAACLAREGHVIIGVDPNETKVGLINDGATPVIEEDLADLIRQGVEGGRISATTDHHKAVADSEMAVVAVGTPSQPNGNIDLSHVQDVMKQIGSSLAERESFYVVVLRSTVLPGTVADVVIPALEQASGKKAGTGFGACFNPEFLREGSAVADFDDPPKTVVGATDAASRDAVISLFSHLQAPLIVTDPSMAEFIKYVDNAWHALKVGFANEIGRIGKALGLDARKLMEHFVADTKLNVSDTYLKPGQAFGGSCLPKDLRALTYKAKLLDLQLPIIESILPSNELHIDRSFEMIAGSGGRRVGILGLSFKGGTDDVRESPMIAIVERLIGKGYDVRIFDPTVSVAALVGANREFLLKQIPHISGLLVDQIDALIDHADTLVIGTDHEAFSGIFDKRKPGQVVIDLVRAFGGETLEDYHGICW